MSALTDGRARRVWLSANGAVRATEWLAPAARCPSPSAVRRLYRRQGRDAFGRLVRRKVRA